MSNGEVKLGLYMTTGRAHSQTFRAICDMVEKLLPNGEIRVTTPYMQDLERIVAEKDAEIERLKRERAKYEADCKRIEYFDDLHEKVATQARVIEKLKTYVQHRVDCICRAGVLQYSDSCDCGLEAIEKGEE